MEIYICLVVDVLLSCGGYIYIHICLLVGVLILQKMYQACGGTELVKNLVSDE